MIVPSEARRFVRHRESRVVRVVRVVRGGPLRILRYGRDCGIDSHVFGSSSPSFHTE